MRSLPHAACAPGMTRRRWLQEKRCQRLWMSKERRDHPKPPSSFSILNIEAVRHVTALYFVWEDRLAWLRVGPQLWGWRMLPPPPYTFC